MKILTQRECAQRHPHSAVLPRTTEHCADARGTSHALPRIRMRRWKAAAPLGKAGRNYLGNKSSRPRGIGAPARTILLGLRSRLSR